MGAHTLSWAASIAAYCTHLRAAGRSIETVKLRRVQLHRFARDVGRSRPGLVTLDDVERWMGSQRWARDTRRSHQAAVRTYYAWLVKTGRLQASPVEDLAPIRGSAPNPMPVADNDYRFALQVADPRDRLMVRLAGGLGLRRGEVAQVHTRDVFRDLVGWSLTVHGKGGKIRVMPIPDDLAHELQRHGDGYVFPGRIDGHLSPAYVGKRVRRLLPDRYSMHKLRHRFGTAAYALSGDLAAVQDLLGHASPATTRRYVRVPDHAKRSIVESV